MKIIQPANEKILRRLERFFWNYDEKLQYKIAGYVIPVDSCNETTLLYNDVTKELIELDPGEDIFTQFFLMHLFIVPMEFNEAVIPMTVREIFTSQRNYDLRPMGYTILTTTACNARCFYCYEKNDPKKPMSEKTANDVADFIIKNYEKYGPKPEELQPDANGKIPTPATVRLSWFGGEPLFRKKCISIICSKLREAKVPYTSSMISNGYLFNDETVKEAKELWRLRNVQITVDGTRDIYNKTKAYIYKDEDPFETIMGNIERLTNYKVRVSIRINVGMFNIDDVRKLIDEIGFRFGGNRFVSVYLHSLFDAFDSDMTSEENNRIVFTKMAEFEDVIRDMGLGSSGKMLTNSYSGTHCMADSGKHLCILTDGRLTLCEHYTHSNEIGTIYDFPEKIDYDMMAKYHEIKEPYPRCYSCPLFADCSYLKICADNDNVCSEARQQYLISKLIRRIKMRYAAEPREEKPSEENHNEEENKSAEC